MQNHECGVVKWRHPGDTTPFGAMCQLERGHRGQHHAGFKSRSEMDLGYECWEEMRLRMFGKKNPPLTFHEAGVEERVYHTESGNTLTNADIEALADEAEKGYDVEPLRVRDEINRLKDENEQLRSAILHIQKIVEGVSWRSPIK